MVKSNLQIWGIDFPIGGEWDAKATPPHVPREQAGRVTVRRESQRFVVIFARFHTQPGEQEIKEFPPTEQGEIDAKTFALTFDFANFKAA